MLSDGDADQQNKTKDVSSDHEYHLVENKFEKTIIVETKEIKTNPEETNNGKENDQAKVEN